VNIKAISFFYFSLGFLFLSQPTLKAQDDFPISGHIQSLLDLEYKKAIQLANISKNDLYKAQAISLGEVIFKAGQQPHQFLPPLKNETPKEIRILNLLQLGYYKLYYTPYESETLKYFFEAREISKTLGNQDLQKITLLAILEFYHFEYAQTHNHYEKYLKELKFISKSPIEKCWVQLYTLYFLYQAITYRDEDLIDETFIVLEQELVHLKKDHAFFTLYNAIKAVQFEYDKDLDSALVKYNFVIDHSKNIPFLNYLVFRSYIRISEIYYKKKEYKKGLIAIDKASCFIDKSNTLKGNIYINKFSSKHHNALGNYERAYDLLNQSVKEQYELDYKENSIQNSSLEIELQTAEKEKQLLISEKKNKQKENIVLGLVGGIFGVSLIGFLLFKNTKRKQRIAEQQSEIEIQKTEKLLKEQEIISINAMIDGQEKERNRLASDLHDSVGATLAAAKLQFEYLSKITQPQEQTQLLFSKTGQLLEDAYKEVRSMAHVKNSGVIAKNGLLPAVKKLARNVSTNDELVVEVRDFGLENRLDGSLEITIFRIIQELITNIVKHAKATEAGINITQHDDTLSIIIEDNGKGFYFSKYIDKDGMGLSSIDRRVEHLEGTLEIDSSPGKGTTILIDIPL
jgi:signal transduction histidine kinase